jgi:hypothetical protein
VILIAGTAADSDGAHHFAIFFERNATREDHDLAIVGGVDTKELVTRL